MKVVESTVITRDSFTLLIDLMNSMIRTGWEPQGGICKDNHRFYHTMVKVEKSCSGDCSGKK